MLFRSVTTKIRYNYGEVRAIAHPLPGNRARLEFLEPQRSVSPGQAAVCYVGDRVIGGGWIERTEIVPKEVFPKAKLATS